MKKTIILLLVLILSTFSGCRYIAYKDYYNDISDYNDIWDLTGFWHGYETQSPLFPESVENLDVKTFFCRYDQQLPLGEGVQLHIEIGYDETALEDEIQRISNLASLNEKNFNSEKFTAYDIRLGKDSCWEYALIDSNDKTIHYIFLHHLPKKAIELEHDLIPDNYVDYPEEEQK